MTETVFCIKHQKELPALKRQPFPGPDGEFILNNVSQQAWMEWLQHQTLLINEKHLNLMESETQVYLAEQRKNFFENKDVDAADGFVPQSKEVK